MQDIYLIGCYVVGSVAVASKKGIAHLKVITEKSFETLKTFDFENFWLSVNDFLFERSQSRFRVEEERT